MIKIEILRDNEGKIASFKASGHSLYKKKGEDIVCSGVSAILQTAILGLSGYLNLRLDVQKQNGLLDVTLLSKTSPYTSAILETMRLSLYKLKEKYPNYIEIIDK